MVPGPPQSQPPSSIAQLQCDYDTLSEKYWGEILERTVSSNSLQTLQQRTYSTVSEHPYLPSQQKICRSNGHPQVNIFPIFFLSYQ